MRYVLVVAICGACAATPALADRAGRSELTLQVVGSSSESSDGEVAASLDVDADVGFAVGAAHNFNEHLAVGLDVSFLNPDYTAVLSLDGGGTATVSTELDIINGNLYAAWNFVDGPLTPYVQAGLGWTYLDSNISDGLPATGCWWDPWWGYTCARFYDTYDDTRFSYGFGVGVRYELQGGMFVKAGYQHTEIDGEGDGADPSFELWRLELGWVLGGW